MTFAPSQAQAPRAPERKSLCMLPQARVAMAKIAVGSAGRKSLGRSSPTVRAIAAGRQTSPAESPNSRRGRVSEPLPGEPIMHPGGIEPDVGSVGFPG